MSGVLVLFIVIICLLTLLALPRLDPRTGRHKVVYSDPTWSQSLLVRRIQATASQLVKLSRRKRRKRRQQKTRQRGCRRVRGRGESWEAARVGKLKAGLV